VVFVEVRPEQLGDAGLCALWAVSRDAHRDKYQLLLEGHQLGEGRTLVRPKLADLPVERFVLDRVLQTGTFQGPGLRAEGCTQAWGSRRKGTMGKGHRVKPFNRGRPRAR